MKNHSERNKHNHHAPKRIVFFHDSHGYGGMELYLFRLIRHLDTKRYQPAVLVPGYTDEFRSSSPKFIEEVRERNLHLLRPQDPGDLPIFSTVKEISSIAQALRSHGADLLHVHTCRPEGARKAVIAARLAGIKGVLRTEHFPPSVTIGSTSKFLVRPIDWLTDYIVTGSEGDRQEQIHLLKRSPDKVFRSYNSVEVENFNPQHDVREAKIRLGLDPDLPVIGTVGRLVPQKGHVYLIEAATQVIEAYGPVQVLLVGDGELQSELEAQVESLGISDFVYFAGFQENVAPYMEAMDIGVMPSLFEVFSLAMLEFMALGKPVVASDHSSFLEAITDGENGLIVPMKDSKPLAEAVLKLLRDESLRLRIGKSALKRVRENFNYQRLANDMMDLYDHILLSKDIPVDKTAVT